MKICEIARRVVHNFHSASPGQNELAQLSSRENEILNLLAKGLLYKEIASQLFIRTETVRKHVHNIYQ